jgi:hypothetical protein
MSIITFLLLFINKQSAEVSQQWNHVSHPALSDDFVDSAGMPQEEVCYCGW